MGTYLSTPWLAGLLLAALTGCTTASLWIPRCELDADCGTGQQCVPPGVCEQVEGGDPDGDGADGDAATDGDGPPDGDAATDGDEPPDGDTGADGDPDPDGDSQTDGDLPADGDEPADGDAPCLPSDRCLTASLEGGECVQRPVVCQQDDNPCTVHECDSTDGACRPRPFDAACPDDDPCNGEERCRDGVCQPGRPLECGSDETCGPQGCRLQPCTGAGCAPGRRCRADDGREGLCGGTIDFDRNLAGTQLESDVDVQELFREAGLTFSTDQSRARVMTNSYELQSDSGNNSCATRQEPSLPFQPPSYWRGNILIRFVLPEGDGVRQAGTNRVVFYVGNTWAGGLQIDVYDPQQQFLGSGAPDNTGGGTDLVTITRTDGGPIGLVNIRPGNDPDFTIDDLSFGPILP